MLLFSVLLLPLLEFFKMNASSREKEGRRSGGRGRNLLLNLFLGGEKLSVSWEFLLNTRWFVRVFFFFLWVSILHQFSLSRAGQIVPLWLNLIFSFIKLIQWKGFICQCEGCNGHIQDLTMLFFLTWYCSGACPSAGGCRLHRHDEVVLYCTELWVGPL